MANPLSRLSMQNQIRDRIENEIGNKIRPTLEKQEKATNLGSKEVDALKGIIKRETQVIERGSKPRMITLAEAAEKIKGR